MDCDQTGIIGFNGICQYVDSHIFLDYLELVINPSEIL